MSESHTTQAGSEPSAAQQRRKRRANPFYALLVLTATTFTFTALLYIATDLGASGGTGIRDVMDRHGTALLVVQGALIVVLSLAAMALDSWRWKGMRRITREKRNEGGKLP